MGLSDERPDRAWLIHQLHSAQASGIFAADGHFVRSVDRVGTACGKKSTGQGLIARLMIGNNAPVRQTAKQFWISKSMVYAVVTIWNDTKAKSYGRGENDERNIFIWA